MFAFTVCDMPCGKLATATVSARGCKALGARKQATFVDRAKMAKKLVIGKLSCISKSLKAKNETVANESHDQVEHK